MLNEAIGTGWDWRLGGLCRRAHAILDALLLGLTGTDSLAILSVRFRRKAIARSGLGQLPLAKHVGGLLQPYRSALARVEPLESRPTEPLTGLREVLARIGDVSGVGFEGYQALGNAIPVVR